MMVLGTGWITWTGCGLLVGSPYSFNNLFCFRPNLRFDQTSHKDAHFWGQRANPVFSRIIFQAVTAYPKMQKSGGIIYQRIQLYIKK
jgi:hypothetical protein